MKRLTNNIYYEPIGASFLICAILTGADRLSGIYVFEQPDLR